MLDLDRFIADCRSAAAKDPSFGSLRQIVARAVSDPTEIIQRFGEPRQAGVKQLFHSADLNIINFV